MGHLAGTQVRWTTGRRETGGAARQVLREDRGAPVKPTNEEREGVIVRELEQGGGTQDGQRL